MRHSRVAYLVAGVLSLMLAACSSSDDGSTSSAATSASGTAEAAGTASTAAATSAATSESGGGGTARAVPTFADGPWTGGEAQLQISGDLTGTIAGTLFSESSATEPGTTRLTYTAGLDTILFSISTQYEPFDLSASTSDDLRVERPFGTPPCEVNYEEATEGRVAGTFRCEGVRVASLAQGIDGTGVAEGSFEATR